MRDNDQTGCPQFQLPSRILLDLATLCNLRCPQCPVWGSGRTEDLKKLAGVMGQEERRRILDEVKAVAPLIQPNMYGEPLLAPGIRDAMAEMKALGITVAMNTNGLALTPDLADYFVSIGLDSIFFSLDGVTPDTLEKIRGIRDLDRLENAVHIMLTARGDGTVPRIGVSFTEQEANHHETAAFIARWAGRVDCVRIGLYFKEGRFEGMPDPGPRKPCPAIYSTMPIHHDGTATICCLDGFKTTHMGNVFTDGGVEAVWNGPGFLRIRRLHEAGHWDRIALCRNCNGWAQYEFDEEERDGLLIRRSPQYTYYNRIDRLGNWQGSLLGGHRLSRTG